MATASLYTPKGMKAASAAQGWLRRLWLLPLLLGWAAWAFAAPAGPLPAAAQGPASTAAADPAGASTSASATASTVVSMAASASIERIRLEVFVRRGCPHCAAAKVFLAELQGRRPDLDVVLRPIDADPDNRDRLMTLSRTAGIWPPGVPTFVVHGRLLVGFDDAQHLGRELETLIDQGPLPTSPNSADPAASAPQVDRAAPGGVDAGRLGVLDVRRLGLPLFTLAIGLLDGFNPCATWVLLFLLALLVRLQDRRRMALIAGTFVLASGAVYYAFMAAWLNLFLAVGLAQPVRWALGVLAILIGALNVKDFFVWGQGPSLAIPDAAKPGLVARMRQVLSAPSLTASLAGVATLAVVVNFVELLCTAGLPAVFTAVLSQQQLSPAAHHAYLLLYILGYVADDTLMVATAVFALSSGKLTERAGRRLKFVSGAVMLALGIVLLLRPQWLD